MQVDLEQLLSSLGSERANAEAVLKLSEKMDVPENLLRRSVELFEKIKDNRKAAILYEKLGDNEKAIVNCIKANYRAAAERIAKEAGIPKFLVQAYEDLGIHVLAADAANKLGMTERTIENYVKAEMPSLAADVASKANQKEKAFHLYVMAIIKYIKNESLESAALCAEEAGLPELATELYSIDKQQRLEEEAVKKAETQKTTKPLYKRSDENLWEMAKKVENKNPVKAIKLYNMSGHFEQSYRVAKEAGLEDQMKILAPLAVRQE